MSKPERRPVSMPSNKPVFSKADAFRLFEVLGQMKEVVTEPRHLYALVRLRRALQAEAESIAEMSKTSVGIQNFETKRLALCQAFSSKDSSGSPLISPDKNYIIDADRRSEFDARIQDLQAEHRKDLEAHQESLKKIAAIAAEPSEVSDLPKIPLSALTGAVSMEQMEALFPVLVDESIANV